MCFVPALWIMSRVYLCYYARPFNNASASCYEDIVSLLCSDTMRNRLEACTSSKGKGFLFLRGEHLFVFSFVLFEPF
eukprot:m.20281 g.20281  ORF g.20281 m.20281 type:complete len:77 (-) comp8848_c0_seq2:2-232(-)